MELLTITLLLLGAGGCKSLDFSCSKDVCTKQKCSSVPFGCSKAEDGTVKSGYYFPSPSPCNCCEYCVAWLNEGAGCLMNASASMPSSMCGPGLSCSPETLTCEPIVTTCTLEQQAYDNHRKNGRLGITMWRPICDEKGEYSYVKCIPNSICYCVDPQRGTRIFGEKIYLDATVPSAMNCGCGLSAWRTSRLGFEAESVHCMPDGSFDPLQCIGGNCTCVNPIDGSSVASNFVYVSELKKGALPCFDPSLHSDGKFLRSCEEKRKEMQALMETTDYTWLNSDLPTCSADGRYAPLQIVGDRRRCVDPEGNMIEDFQWRGDLSDCECARTRWLLKEGGIQELPACLANGSYRPWQCWRDFCYCVDCMGSQVSPDLSRTELETLVCYNATQCLPNYPAWANTHF